MSSQKSCFKAVFGFSIDTPTFDSGIRKHVFVNCFAESNGFPVIVDRAELSSADISDSTALRKTPYSVHYLVRLRRTCRHRVHQS